MAARGNSLAMMLGLIVICVMSTYPCGVECKFGVNWGTNSSQNLDPRDGVDLVKSYRFEMVRIHAEDHMVLSELGNHPNLEVTVICQNNMLASISESHEVARNWVEQNVVRYVAKGANIRYIVVGNEPFLGKFGDQYKPYVLPAMQNIHRALMNSTTTEGIKITVSFNENVLTKNARPSQTHFKDDIRPLMRKILQFLNETNGAFTVNLNPFQAVIQNHLPLESAFPDSNFVLEDGSNTYYTALEAVIGKVMNALNYEWMLNLEIIVGEIGWPTSGYKEANINNARRFNQALVNPMWNRWINFPYSTQTSVYMYSLVDEDLNSALVDPSQPHWGLADASGKPKYSFHVG